MGENVKHTPGPWLVTRQYVVGPRDESDSQGFGMVVGVADVYGDNRNQDARLIAAAPDLLEAAKDVLKLFRYHTEDAADAADFAAAVEIKIEAAIAKAEARP